MATNNTVCNAQNLLTAILALANEEQNAGYPPFIYQSQLQTITSLLISALVRSYPENPQILDMLDPFVNFKLLGTVNGYFKLPDDYRDILGDPYVFVNKNKDGECGEIPAITNQAQFQNAINKASCNAVPLEIVPQSEFSTRTSSTYKFPTHEYPIAYFSGKKQIKVCPYDLTQVALLYTQNELILNFVYILQPDDTYLLNPNDPNFQDSQWTGAAFEPIYKALVALYSAYTRDRDLTNWSQILKVQGIL